MSWFTHILENWISVPYMEEYLSSVVHPWWLRKLLILLCSLMIYFYLLGCAISFLLFVYKKMNNHKETDDSKLWEKPRKVIAETVEMYGKIWHGHEVIGMENLPKGPGIIIYYHAVAPIGYILFVAKLYKETGRLCYSLVHQLAHFMPGLQTIFDTIGVKAYKKYETVEIMKKGDLMGIAPGGAREALYSHDYSLLWGKRTGFAQAALEAKVPIIPVFTENSCETWRTVGKSRLTRWLYDKTRCMVIPFYGGFPVKLRTFIGEPIPYDPNITAAELAERTKTAIENLRDKYQKRPGSILRALSQRFDKPYKAD